MERIIEIKAREAKPGVTYKVCMTARRGFFARVDGVRETAQTGNPVVTIVPVDDPLGWSQNIAGGTRLVKFTG